MEEHTCQLKTRGNTVRCVYGGTPLATKTPWYNRQGGGNRGNAMGTKGPHLRSIRLGDTRCICSVAGNRCICSVAVNRCI